MYFYGHPPMMPEWVYFNFMNQVYSQNGSFQPFYPQTVLPPPLAPQAEVVNKVEDNASRKGSQDLTKCGQIQKMKPINKLCRETEQDGDYCPEKGGQRKGKKNRQDENRNVIPNTIHQILSFVQKKRKSIQLVGKLLDKFDHEEQWTVKRFYLYQLKIKEKVNHYVNESTLNLLNELHEPECTVYSEAEQRYYLKICRVIIHHFLNNEAAIITLTSKRMNQDKKQDHLRAKRHIQDTLFRIYGKF